MNDEAARHGRPATSSTHRLAEDSTGLRERSRATGLQVFVLAIVRAIEGARETMGDAEYAAGIETLAVWVNRERDRVRRASRRLRVVS